MANLVRGRRPLAVIKAPPGSGKTTLLLRLVSEAVDSGLRVAVAAQTNAQVDDICERLVASHPQVSGYRFAAKAHTPRDFGATVQWVTAEADIALGAVVAVGTTAKWALTDIASPFDVLFVDEAWQMAWGDFMLCSSVAEGFVLIGDPGQIPPVVTIPVDRWETSPRAPHLAAPEVVLADKALTPMIGGLPSCRRLPADAVDLVRPFYDFEFDSWADPKDRQVALGRRAGPSPLDPALELLSSGSVAAATLSTPEGGPPLECDEEIAGLAASLAVRLLERKAKASHDDSGAFGRIKPMDIGLCATHRIMNAAIEAALPAALRSEVRVDTPERWQGLQRKVMIVVHPLSGVVHPSDFDLETGRLCVMASRHQSAMLVVSRDHVRHTLEVHIPNAEQAVGRPDVAGRGHHQHLGFWTQLESSGRVVGIND